MSRRNIMLVCGYDEGVMRKRMALEKRGFQVSIVKNLQSAKYTIPDVRPDLIVTDMMMISGSSIEFCNEIRQVSRVPILFYRLYESAGVYESEVNDDRQLIEQIEAQM